ncbi:membrane protein [Sulfurisphaera javensis]|uniref:Membrane protein n=1 Tax=Sulfurisphaera javensis TaxID=2049879 RepID=A0AAT9GTS3_9CREN
MDLGVFFASLGISLLELSEAGAIAAIYHNILKNNIPFLYAILGVLVVLIPTFTLGKFIYLVPLSYFLLAASVILFYFGYRLLRSARRYFKKQFKKKGEKEEKEGVGVVFTVSAVEGLEASLVILALLPQSYSSALLGAIIAGVAVVILTAVLKAQIAKIRLPHLKFILSALLFSLGTLWLGEVFIGIDEIFLPLFLLIYLGVNYIIIKG